MCNVGFVQYFLFIMRMSCLSFLYVGTHQFLIFPRFCEIATPWPTPLSVQMCIVHLLIKMFLEDIIGGCLSLAPYVFCVFIIVFVIMWFPAFGNTTV